MVIVSSYKKVINHREIDTMKLLEEVNNHFAGRIAAVMVTEKGAYVTVKEKLHGQDHKMLKNIIKKWKLKLLGVELCQPPADYTG